MAFAKLPRLPLSVALVEAGRTASTTFQRWWQTVCERLEAQETKQDATLEQISAALGLIDAAQASANAAAASAATAQAAVDDLGSNSALILGHVVPTSILTATDAGASATITIAGHTRVYGDNTSVAVTGGSITGLAYSSSYAVYYDDLTRAGGAVTYHATTTQTDAAADISIGRHFVGLVQTPAALAAATTGIGALPVGFSPPLGYIFL